MLENQNVQQIFDKRVEYIIAKVKPKNCVPSSSP